MNNKRWPRCRSCGGKTRLYRDGTHFHQCADPKRSGSFTPGEWSVLNAYEYAYDPNTDCPECRKLANGSKRGKHNCPGCGAIIEVL